MVFLQECLLIKEMAFLKSRVQKKGKVISDAVYIFQGKRKENKLNPQILYIFSWIEKKRNSAQMQYVTFR